MLKNKAQVISQNHIETFGFNKTISRIELVGLFEVLLAVIRILKGPWWPRSPLNRFKHK